MNRPYPIFKLFRRLHRSAFFEKVSLFTAMYVVTVSLFWFETGMLSKGLLFGLIAASLKTAIARGHARIFAPVCEPVSNSAELCDSCSDDSPGAMREVGGLEANCETAPMEGLRWSMEPPCGHALPIHSLPR